MRLLQERSEAFNSDLQAYFLHTFATDAQKEALCVAIDSLLHSVPGDDTTERSRLQQARSAHDTRSVWKVC